MSNTPMLQLRGVTKTFFPGTINEKVALNNLAFTMEPGDFVTVIGGNGAGKSTMLNAVAGNCSRVTGFFGSEQ